MRSFRTSLFTLLLLLTLSFPIYGQQELITAPVIEPPDYSAVFPTVAALEVTEPPARDRLDLAERLLDIGEIAATPVPPPLRQEGEVEVFTVLNSDANISFEVEGELRAIGKHIYLWVERSDTSLPTAALVELASLFDEVIYPETRALWGGEANPGVDGDPRIYGLFASGIGPTAAAYFSSDNSYPRQVVATSNAHEMFLFNLDALYGYFSVEEVGSIVAHEFQHMIRHNQQLNTELWLNEGLSEFTQRLLFNDPGYFAYEFLAYPDTQLNTWVEESFGRSSHYGAALLFVSYFHNRYGLEALHTLSEVDTARGLNAFDQTLQAIGEPGVNAFFADWVLANLLHNEVGVAELYRYALSPGVLANAAFTATADLPYQTAELTSQYATDYFSLCCVEEAQTIRIEMTAGTVSPLIEDVENEGRFWYSNRADVSDTTLTRGFDLSDVTTATLNYRLWHNTEEFWDYGYVMASTDEGAMWELLRTPEMSEDNPYGTAYGAGYNDESGGWIDQQIALDEYAGGEVLVRFEMINDDGVNLPGMAIDSVAVPEIGYAADFETDDGGWAAAGWLLTDNRLPRQAWVQLVQLDERNRVLGIERWLLAPDVNGDLTTADYLTPLEGTWETMALPDTVRVYVAVSPFAPVTTVPMSYALSVAVTAGG